MDHAPKGKDVDRVGVRLCLEQLGCHVERCPNRRLRLVHLGGEFFGDPKVTNLEDIRAQEEDVLGLDVCAKTTKRKSQTSLFARGFFLTASRIQLILR